MIYGEITLIDVLASIGMGFDDLFRIMDRFTNWELFDKTVSSHNHLILKEFVTTWRSQQELYLLY